MVKNMNTVSNIKAHNLALWTAGIGTAALLALGAAQAQTGPVLSVTQVNDGTLGDCTDLLAGQTIDVGYVCYEVVGNEYMTVNYHTEGGWELTEAQLWVGEDQDGYPMAKNGNPKIGNFPYNAGDITGATMYSFSVPLGSVQTFFDLDTLDSYCDQSDTIYALAHASVQLVDGGTVVQTETGWSFGEGAVEKGSWATRTAIELSVTCDDTLPPPPASTGQETALMFGGIELNNGSDGICDESPAERWGWQEGPLSEGSHQREIWAAAGNNLLTNGTNVGYVDIVVSAENNVTVTPVLIDGFEAEETHIYIGTAPVCSAAFGNDWKSLASTDIDTSGGVYVGVHFSVLAECGINSESPDNFCE